MTRHLSRGLPKLPDDPRKFFRVATQRFAEARFLFEGDRYAIAIYIAGYSVECGLKALILTTEPAPGQKALAESFRGTGWHQFHRLVDFYFNRGGARLSSEIAMALSYVGDGWSVEMSYLQVRGHIARPSGFLSRRSLSSNGSKGGCEMFNPLKPELDVQAILDILEEKYKSSHPDAKI